MPEILASTNDHYKIIGSILQPKKKGTDPVFVKGSIQGKLLIQYLDSGEPWYANVDFVEEKWSFASPLPGYANLDAGICFVSRASVNSYYYGLNVHNFYITSLTGKALSIESFLCYGGKAFFEGYYPEFNFMLENKASGAFSRAMALEYREPYPFIHVLGQRVGRLKDGVLEVNAKLFTDLDCVTKVFKDFQEKQKVDIKINSFTLED